MPMLAQFNICLSLCVEVSRQFKLTMMTCVRVRACVCARACVRVFMLASVVDSSVMPIFSQFNICLSFYVNANKQFKLIRCAAE